MPAMANITVKKNDGTTDVVYTVVSASGGDRSPAIWRNNTVGTAASHRPELTSTFFPNGTKSARKGQLKYQYPSLVTGGDGAVSVKDRLIIEVNVVIPLGMSDAEVNEAVSQGLNLAAASLTKDQFKSGYAAT